MRGGVCVCVCACVCVCDVLKGSHKEVYGLAIACLS